MQDNLTKEEQKFLLNLARRALEYYFQYQEIFPLRESDIISKKFLEKRGVFVTLWKNGELRGCIGSLEPQKSIIQSVIENALSSALFDPRFVPVNRQELDDIKIEISILSPLKPLKVNNPKELLDYLARNKPGLVLDCEGARATFLPQVWEEIDKPQEFLEQLSLKAGLNKDAWKSKEAKFFEYEAFVFQE